MGCPDSKRNGGLFYDSLLDTTVVLANFGDEGGSSEPEYIYRRHTGFAFDRRGGQASGERRATACCPACAAGAKASR